MYGNFICTLWKVFILFIYLFILFIYLIYFYFYSSKLEKELQFLFKDQLRAAGGTGTLSLSEYLAATMSRTGRRAVLP